MSGWRNDQFCQARSGIVRLAAPLLKDGWVGRYGSVEGLAVDIKDKRTMQLSSEHGKLRATGSGDGAAVGPRGRGPFRPPDERL